MSCRICAVAAVCLLSLWLKAEAGLPEMLSISSQMVVVTTKDWAATDGTMRRFERTEQGWQQVGIAVPVVVGRNGMGWGRGLNPPSPSGPQKKEGDGRSPAGVFRLPHAFGYAPAANVRPIKLPYIQCTSSVECVDDTNSTSYNSIVDRRLAAKVDWKSSEKMRRSDDEYELGVFVAQNSSPTEPGAGSCVFLHIWKEPGHPTGGCTAMSMGSIFSLLGWLDPRSNPVLVQLPQAEYEQKRIDWAKPEQPQVVAPALQLEPRRKQTPVILPAIQF